MAESGGETLLPWSIAQTAELGIDSADLTFLGVAPMLPTSANITSVKVAVDKLNGGELHAANGICICYSRDKSRYYGLWTKDSSEVAKTVFNLVDAGSGGQVTAQSSQGLRFTNRHATFMGNLRLAITVALWATIFGLPMYSPAWIHDTIFGEMRQLSQLSDAQGEPLVPGSQAACQGSNIFGMVYDSASDLDMYPNHMVAWDEHVHGEWVEGGFANTSYPQVWCGFLPQNYAGNWPNVIQMILFTAYFTTGITVQQAWQGIVGTFLATANVSLLGLVYHTGALAHVDEHGQFMRKADGSLDYVHEDYSPMVGYANFAIVTLLFLVCTADVATIKFGLSWHMTYMMNFVNPSVGNAKGLIPIEVFGLTLPGQWDSYRTVVLLTSIAGAGLAVLATLFPFKLLNMAMIKDDGDTIVSAIDSIWKDSIEYFCGDHPKGKKAQIAAKIDSLQGTISSVNGHLSTAWWECFDIGKRGRTRLFFQMFDNKVGNETTRHLLYAVKGCVLNESFDESHKHFCQKLNKDMDDLRAETAGLLHILLGVCREAECDDKWKQLIAWKIDLIREAQLKLLSHYEKAGDNGGPPGIEKKWAHEYTFIFALSHWANAMLRFALHIQDETQMPSKQGIGQMVKGQIISTFAFHNKPGGMFAPQHLNFAMRNTLSIGLAFFLGIFLHGMGFTMYRPYSATMAGTLSLLISNVGGSAFEKNLKRLLGVVLGKVIPIIIVGNLDYFGCQNTDRFVAQSVAVFVFIFAFEYIYFTSSSWGYVGGLVAAFGCYPLMTYPTCVGFHEDTGMSTYVSNYEELCEVTTCILLQMFVDVLLEQKSARDLACEYVEQTTTIAATCLDEFFKGADAKALRDIRTTAKVALDLATTMVPEVDPVKEVAPGPAIPFNLGLYREALDVLQLLLSDLSMIIMAIHEVKGHEEMESMASEGTMKKILKDLKSWKMPEDGNRMSFQEDCSHHIDAVAKVLLLLLRKKEESPIEDQEGVAILTAMEKNPLGRAVLGRAKMYADCSRLEQQGAEMSRQESGTQILAVKDVFAVRISVIVVACDNIVKHMGELAQLCVQANIH